MVAEDPDGNVLGACLNYDFDSKWSKIAALFVFKEHRGKGIGKALFFESFRDITKRKRNIYATSSNPLIIRLMKECDFVVFRKLLALKNECPMKHRLNLCVHTIVWFLNPYRIREILRKVFTHKFKEPFFLGIKINSRKT